MKKVYQSIALPVVAMLLALCGMTTPQNAYAAPSQTVGEYIDDSVITASVKTVIFEEKGLSSLKISIETHDGVVLLTGTIDSAENARFAGRITKQVDGVRRVINELRVETAPEQSASIYIDDAVITASVKNAILSQQSLAALAIGVETKDGIVTLTGATDTAEHAKLAEQTAKKTDGVKRVVNQLTNT